MLHLHAKNSRKKTNFGVQNFQPHFPVVSAKDTVPSGTADLTRLWQQRTVLYHGSTNHMETQHISKENGVKGTHERAPPSGKPDATQVGFHRYPATADLNQDFHHKKVKKKIPEKGKRRTFLIGTWNLRAMPQNGKPDNLLKELNDTGFMVSVWQR